ncbi:tRNA synthetases class I family protein [Mycobacterium kansasii]|uniref:Isoleucine--tRNA ligase n=1 Tax=Mycobacterium kansasii TaxID=1768 RepID=A0A1V3XFP4_MYCKA|nr:tRNA synthetases class I family protein [Mycobacterium kansasii]
MEAQVLEYWARDDTFRASIARRDGAPEYVFYDGPPFANGLPHYGHLLTGYVKDIVPRYRTMRGYKVERRFGWDTHGLPAELEVERQLGITDKSQIDAMGIAAFNDACRASVLRYTGEWQAYVTRQARWVDFDNDYKTLDLSYMESVIWAFKQLWDKGLAYEGYRVLPYCWRDETPLSNHELRMDDDVYQSRQDPAITVGFKVAGGQPLEELAGAFLLVWTTTPWTLPSNLAVAVNPRRHMYRSKPAIGALCWPRQGCLPTLESSEKNPRFSVPIAAPTYWIFGTNRPLHTLGIRRTHFAYCQAISSPPKTVPASYIWPGVRRRRHGGRGGCRHRAGDSGRCQGPLRRHRRRLPGAARVRRQCPDHP